MGRLSREGKNATSQEENCSGDRRDIARSLLPLQFRLRPLR
jgi:hypothetical protein